MSSVRIVVNKSWGGELDITERTHLEAYDMTPNTTIHELLDMAIARIKAAYPLEEA